MGIHDRDPLNPCIGVCSVTGLNCDIVCKGCGRTIEEHRDWGTYSNTTKAIKIVQGVYRLQHYDEAVVVEVALTKTKLPEKRP